MKLATSTFPAVSSRQLCSVLTSLNGCLNTNGDFSVVKELVTRAVAELSPDGTLVFPTDLLSEIQAHAPEIISAAQAVSGQLGEMETRRVVSLVTLHKDHFSRGDEYPDYWLG